MPEWTKFGIPEYSLPGDWHRHLRTLALEPVEAGPLSALFRSQRTHVRARYRGVTSTLTGAGFDPVEWTQMLRLRAPDGAEVSAETWSHVRAGLGVIEPGHYFELEIVLAAESEGHMRAVVHLCTLDEP